MFDTIARNAARLCEAEYCFVYSFDGQLLHFVAHDGVTREGVEAVSRAFPSQPSRGSVAGRAVLYCDVARIPDVHADPDFALGSIARAAGYRSALGVPMVRNGLPIGAIALGRSQLGFFPVRQIDLIKFFADQAVIATGAALGLGIRVINLMELLEDAAPLILWDARSGIAKCSRS